MGKKAKTSRKGKKAWRANISTEDIEDYFEKVTKDALSGGPLSAVPSESLFYIDKSSKDIPIKRKIEKHREKILHCDSILRRNSFVNPVPSSKQKKSKKKSKEVPNVELKSHEDLKDANKLACGLTDIWNETDEGNRKSRKKQHFSLIPAVEVDHPGCSFNPPFEAHQDALAQAVAMEMQKAYQKELEPQPIPLTVEGEVIDDEQKYFLDAEDGSDDMDEEFDSNSSIISAQRPTKTKRVTRVELNRRARRKGQMKAEEETKKRENISKEIDSLQDIIKEIANEDEKKQRRHVRRVIAKQERLRSGPPRLGKHKFEPAPLQVLLSEEISGSLRQLKGCCTLARDRFKSLEKRGLIVPTGKGIRH